MSAARRRDGARIAGARHAPAVGDRVSTARWRRLPSIWFVDCRHVRRVSSGDIGGNSSTGSTLSIEAIYVRLARCAIDECLCDVYNNGGVRRQHSFPVNSTITRSLPAQAAAGAAPGAGIAGLPVTSLARWIVSASVRAVTGTGSRRCRHVDRAKPGRRNALALFRPLARHWLSIRLAPWRRAVYHRHQ